MFTITQEDKLTRAQTVPKDSDSVFPGENWFFYWKTSASLWKSKIEEFPGRGRILVPINWSFHTETGDSIDFAELRPETDLKRLVEVAAEVGREMVFMMPLSPVPFLTNGGIPHLLSRNLSIGSENLIQTFCNSEGELTKLYSFFDTRVFQAYSRFCKTLGQYLSTNGVGVDLYGFDCGYIGEDGYQTFFYDRSKTYEQAFGRFLSTRQVSSDDSEEKLSPIEEKFLSVEFLKTIQSLYLDTAINSLTANWEGTIRVSLIGASPEDFFNRLNHVEDQEKYLLDSLDSLSYEVMPSLIMLPERPKHGILKKFMDEEVSHHYMAKHFTHSYMDEDESAIFKPLRFFSIYSQKSLSNDYWHQLGLWDYVINDYGWCFLDTDIDEFQVSEESSNQGISFFQGADVDKNLFHEILKMFMNGGKVILSRSGLDLMLLKKLETFFLENSLEVEKINFHTTVFNIALGEGRLLVVDGDKLADLEPQVKSAFWKKILSTFEIRHLQMNYPAGVYSFWNTRVSNHNELSYEEIRRLSLYNPTSYKKKFKVTIPKNYSLTKIVHKDLVNFEAASKVLEIEMLPGGVLTMNFGVFE